MATKEQYAQAVGVGVDEVTEEELKLYNEENPEQVITEDVPTGQPQGDPPIDDNPPEEDPVFKRSELLGRDPLAEDFPLRDRLLEALKDPVRNPQHPNHKLVLDLQKGSREALQKVADLEAALQDYNQLAKAQNDPEREVYGGISREDIRNGDDTEHSEVDWLLAKQKFERVQSANQNVTERRQAQLQETWSAIDGQAEAVKGLYPDADTESMIKRFVPFDRQGSPNQDHKPLTFEEAYTLGVIDKSGGYAKMRESILSEGRAAGRREVLEEQSKGGGRTITNKTGIPPKPASSNKQITAQDFSTMNAEQIAQATNEILGPDTETYEPIFGK